MQNTEKIKEMVKSAVEKNELKKCLAGVGEYRIEGEDNNRHLEILTAIDQIFESTQMTYDNRDNMIDKVLERTLCSMFCRDELYFRVAVNTYISYLRGRYDVNSYQDNKPYLHYTLNVTKISNELSTFIAENKVWIKSLDNGDFWLGLRRINEFVLDICGIEMLNDSVWEEGETRHFESM
jgi:hypothetical protein